MTKIENHRPYTKCFYLPTDPSPQEAAAQLLSENMQATITGPNQVLITGTYQVGISYLSGEIMKTDISTQNLRQTVTLKDLTGEVVDDLILKVKLEITALTCKPICTKGTITTGQGIQPLSLIPQALAVEIIGNLHLIGSPNVGPAALQTVRSVGDVAADKMRSVPQTTSPPTPAADLFNQSKPSGKRVASLPGYRCK